MFGANSLSTCLQAPHGGVGSLSSVAIAISSKSLSPCETAEATARVSAQIAWPYAEFSMLLPTTISPRRVRNAAPTRKCEYGAYALFSARSAASRNGEVAGLSDLPLIELSAQRGTSCRGRGMKGQTIPQ